jgi:hypothetical protein
MGDASDYADVTRFQRSPEGQLRLIQFREQLKGKQIISVEYNTLSTGVSITLVFEDGQTLNLDAAVSQFSVEALRKKFALVLEREYYKDFPERKKH